MTRTNVSLAESLSFLPASQQREFLDSLRPDEAAALDTYWPFWARPAQIAPPGEWRTWLILAGRGFGKTRTGAEWVRESIKQFSLVNVIAATADDARDIMIEGESGILAICPPDERPHYVATKRRLEWPNGARSLIFTADEPDRLRGKQHMRLWADELAAWRYAESWDQAMFGLRLGSDPRAVITTTPKPVSIIRQLIADPNTVVTRGSTYDNRSNLAPAFYAQIISKYEGTRLGRQELNAELLEDIDGALWQLSEIESHRVKVAPELQRVVVAIDPATTHGPESDETGIAVCGLGKDGEFYVLHGAGYRLSPNAWAKQALDLYDQHKADRIIAERNNGGDMVESTLRTVRAHAPITTIVASRGKTVRAEPIAGLYEQGRVHHVGSFPKLEDQMTHFPVAVENDDQVDALVYALTDLSAGPGLPFGWLRNAA